MKKALKWLGIAVACPILLVLMLMVLIYLPPVQDYAVPRLCAFASEETGIDISVRQFRLKFPLDFHIEGVALKDTTEFFAELDSATVSVEFLPLLGMNVALDEFDVQGVRMNTAEMIDAVRLKGEVKRLTSQPHNQRLMLVSLNDELANVGRLIFDDADLDIVIPDSVPEDTTESEPTKWIFDIAGVKINRSKFRLHTKDMDTSADLASMDSEGLHVDLGNNNYTIKKFAINGTQPFTSALTYKQLTGEVMEATATLPNLMVKGIAIDLGKELYGIDNFVIQGTSKVKSHLSYRLPAADGMDVAADFGELNVTDIRINLKDGKYDVGRMAIISTDEGESSVAYEQLAKNGMNLTLDKLNVQIDSISYADPMSVKCSIRQMAADIGMKMPSSGIDSKFRLENIMATVDMDSAQVRVPYFSLLTANTNLKGNVKMDLNAFDDVHPGQLKADVNGVIGSKDVEQFVDLKSMGVKLPSTISANASVLMSGPKLQAKVKAGLDNARVSADVDMNMNTMAYRLTADADNLNVARYMPQLGVGIFSGKVTAKGRGFDIAKDNINAKIDVRRLQYGGYDLRNITLEGDLSKGLANTSFAIRDRYLDADITINGNIAQLLSMDMNNLNLKKINGDVTAKIRRADLYHLNVIDHPLTITNVDAAVAVKNGFMTSQVKSRNDMLWGDLSIDGLLDTKEMNASVVADLSKVDLKKMGFAEDRMITGFCGNLDVYTNLGDKIRVQGMLSDIGLDDGSGYFLPVDAELDILSNRDTTYAHINASSLQLELEAKGGYMKLVDSFTKIGNELTSQIDKVEIDQSRLKDLYPDMSLYVFMDENSSLMYLLNRMGYSFSNLEIDMTSEKGIGMNGYASVQSLNVDSTQIDDALITITSNLETTRFSADVQNYPGNPLMAFRANVEGELVPRGANVDVKLYDADDKLGIRLGAEAEIAKDSLLLRLTPETPVIGYKEYHLNSDNYLCVHEKNKITTDIQLVADDGTGLKIYSMPNDEALQDLSLTINRFDLTELTAILPYLPNITGYLEGDMHYVQSEDKMTIASDIGIRNMTYENHGLGDIRSEFVLMPDLSSGGESVLDGNLIKDDTEIASIYGRFRSDDPETTADDSYLSAQLDLDRLPLHIVNGFIPDGIIGFNGNADGTMSVEGPLDKLVFNGEVFLDSAHLLSEPYGVNWRINDEPVRIVDSKLILDNFSLYAHNENPLVIQGNVDFSDMDNMSMDLSIRGRDFEAISEKKTRHSVAYGNAFIDVFAKMNGPMSNLNMSGMLNVLAKTNMTYVLEDSPLSTDDQMKGLVTFVDFRDTTSVDEMVHPQISGFNMDLRLKVEDGAQIKCNLNSDGSNYVNLDGGGELRMQYNNAEDLTLTGKYTLNSGEMKYSLPVIPLRTFTIQKGSYVEFMGDPMNPKLNITATEATQAVVSNYGEDRRTVKFNVGVQVTKTLQDMGLQFILEAPEDMTVQNEIDAMGEAQEGKLAVAMLTSGIYMAESNTSSISMNDALNSFLQGQISNIAGNALKTVDVSMGMANVADMSGASYTDYSFSFAKRFWNNRVSVAVGGRYSTAGNAGHSSNAALDNVSLEYRLDSSASKLLRLNYQRNKQDYIEGYVSEYSGGIMLKKKMSALRELFQFKKQMVQPLNRTTVKPNEKK